MAHFYGTVQGSRGEASRLGGKNSGLRLRAASWEGAVEVYLTEKDGVDYAYVALAAHNGSGTSKVLYSGPVSGQRGQYGKKD